MSFIILLRFFSRGIPNYDFKIGRITFIRNSRPLVKKVEEVNKVGSSQYRTELELLPKFAVPFSTLDLSQCASVQKRFELGASSPRCACLPM